MKKVRLGILGVGNMGTGHINNIMNGLVPEVEITAVADKNPAREAWIRSTEEKFKDKIPDLKPIKFFNSAEEMFASGLIDAVEISVPHYDHPKYAILALKSGIHVMCEKPAGVYTLQVREMIEEANRHPELKFGLMFNQRTSTVYRKMKEIIASGELGEIRRTSWIITNWYRPQAYYDSGAWRATWSGEGGGVLLNQCPHNLDLWQWICGMPCKVQAQLHFGKWHDIEVEDDVTAYVEYPNGATGTFITTTGDAPGTNRFEIVCDGGTIVCGDEGFYVKKLEMKETEFTKQCKSAFEAPKCEKIDIEVEPGNPNQHAEVLCRFAAAILRGEELVADGREGINGLTISNAMHLSAWTGEPVTLPFDEEKFKTLLMEHVKTSRRKENIESIISDTTSSYNVR